MVTVKFIRDDNEEFFIDGETWKIPSDGLEGFDYINPLITTHKKAYNDGSFYQSTTVGEKDRTITAVLLNRALNKSMREHLRSFFGVKRVFDVFINYNGVERKFSGYLYAYKLPTKNIYDFLTLTVTILSPQPYLLSVDEFGQNIGQRYAKFGFPLPSIVNKGFVFSVLKYAQSAILENDGDIYTYPRIVIHANGEITNPKVMINDKYIKYNDILKTNDVLTIDLTNDQAQVMLNDTNVIGKTDRRSSFTNFKIEIGSNDFSYDAQTGANLMDVTVYFNKRYGGL